MNLAPRCCESPLLRRLSADLKRYLLREVPGFSVLIGGEQGMGKATTVREAAGAATQACDSADLLLVELPAPVFLYALDQAPPEAHPDALLRGLAIALFEAVVDATLRAWRRRLTADGPLDADAAELLAQLSVELRKAPTLSRLRAFWDEAGLLEAGAFPRHTHPKDQGALEVAALWSIIQVHLMATGKLDEQVNNDQQASRAASLRTEGHIDAQKLFNPIMGMGAAGFIGYETLQLHGGLLAGLATIAAGVATTGILNLASHRALAASEARRVTFKPDTSPRALARLLPGLIRQLHDAGLFPVFVVDELEAVRGGLDLLDRMGAQLRALLTEAAVFVFLVGRGEYHALYGRARQADGGLYGHFAERAFLAYSGDALRSWLAESAGREDATLADAALLRGRMRPLAVLRAFEVLHAEARPELAALHAAEADLQRRFEARLATPEVAAWSARDALHRQLVLEALHTVTAAWASASPPETDAAALTPIDGLDLLEPWERALLVTQIAAVVADLQRGPAPLLDGEGRWQIDRLGRRLAP